MIQRTGSQTPRPAAPASFYSKRFPIAKSQTSCGRLRYSIRGMFDQKNIPFGVLLRKHKQCANSERSSFKERHTASELSGDCKLYVQYWCLSKSVLLIIVSHLSVRMQSHRQPFAVWRHSLPESASERAFSAKTQITNCARNAVRLLLSNSRAQCAPHILRSPHFFPHFDTIFVATFYESCWRSPPELSD